MSLIFTQLIDAIQAFYFQALSIFLNLVNGILGPSITLILIFCAYSFFYQTSFFPVIRKHFTKIIVAVVISVLILADDGVFYSDIITEIFIDLPVGIADRITAIGTGGKSNNILSLLENFITEFYNLFVRSMSQTIDFSEDRGFFGSVASGVSGLFKNIVVQALFLLLGLTVIGAFIKGIVIHLGSILILYLSALFGVIAFYCLLFESTKSTFKGWLSLMITQSFILIINGAILGFFSFIIIDLLKNYLLGGGNRFYLITFDKLLSLDTLAILLVSFLAKETLDKGKELASALGGAVGTGISGIGAGQSASAVGGAIGKEFKKNLGKQQQHGGLISAGVGKSYSALKGIIK